MKFTTPGASSPNFMRRIAASDWAIAGIGSGIRFFTLASLTILFTLCLLSGQVYAQSNPIVIENQQPGSDQWRLTNVGNDINQQIKGYASATSVNKGSSINFYVSVKPAQTYTLQIYRVGWYGGKGGRLMIQVGPLNGVQQPAPVLNTTTGMITAPWSTSYTLNVPTTWTSGIYLVKLINAAGFQNYIVFVVRDDSRTAALLYQQSVTTDQAYNNYPADNTTGKSLYEYNSYGSNTVALTPRAVKVSFDRPYANNGAGLFFVWEYNLIRWLERSGYDVTYSTNIDTHLNGPRLRNYKGFLSTGHDEYWSKEMFDAAEVARDAGVNLAFFGGNAVYWQARFENSASGVPARVMVSYKNASIDPISNFALKTILFRDTGRPEQRLIGIQYVTYANGFENTAPYIVQNSDHWIYANTSFQNGNSVPGIVGYEVDRYFTNYPLPVNTSYTLLSASPFNGSIGTVTAHSSIYQAPSKAWVFAAGTMSWSWALDKPGYIDTRIQQITANLLNRFVRGAPPVVTNPGPQNRNEGDVVALNISASDPDGQPLTYSASGLPTNLAINPTTGQIAGTLTFTSAGVYTATVSAFDGVDSTTVTFGWTVNNTNQPPAVTNPGNQGSTEGDTVALSIAATDLDGDPITYSASDLPTGLTIDPTTGQITGILAATSAGSYNVRVTVSDSIGSTTVPFTWNVVARNQPPSIVNPGDQNSLTNQTISLPISAADPDGAPLTYSATGLPPALAINATTGVIAGTVSRTGVGDYNVTVTVSDGALTTSAAFVWSIVSTNQAPTITNPGNQNNPEGATITLPILAVDADGDPLDFSAAGLPPALAINPITGLITGTLTSSSAGTYNVTLSVSDGIATVSASFVWSVAATNLPPVITNPGNQTNSEDETVSLLIEASDPEGAALTFSATDLPAGLTINPTTGEIQGTLTLSSAGVYNVNVSASDGVRTAATSFTWSVTNLNQPPTVTNPGLQINSEGDNVNLTIGGSDPDNNTLTFSALGLPANLTIEATSGRIVGTLTPESAGIYAVTVTASDGSASGSTSFLWTVRNINRPPVITNPGNQTNAVGDSVALAIVASDPDGDVVTFSATGLPPGLAIDRRSGVITGTLTAASAGSYNVTVRAADEIFVSPTSFTWLVTTVNRAPTITNPGNRSNQEGEVISLAVQASDLDGDVLTYSASGLPAGLTINPSSGLIAGTLATGSAGNYNVTVTVRDATLSASATFQWTITTPTTCGGLVQEAETGVRSGAFVVANDVNASGGQYLHVPDGSFTFGFATFNPAQQVQFCVRVATAGTYRIKAVVNAPDYNANSFFVRVDGLPISGYTWDFYPVNGTFVTDFVSERNGPDPVEIALTAGDHTLAFGLREDGSRLDKFQLELATVVNRAPTITNPGNRSNQEGEVISLAVQASDLDGDVLTYSASGLPAGLTINPSSGLIAGTLATGSAGSFNVTVTVRDAALSASATFQWTITTPTTCGGLVQEAETGVRSGAFVVANDVNASGGQYLHVPDGSFTFGFATFNPAQQVQFCVRVATAGTYRIKAVVNGPDFNANSFFVRVDGLPISGYTWDFYPVNGTFVTDFVSERNGPDPLEIALTAGDHTLAFGLREDGSRLDKFQLEATTVAAASAQDSEAAASQKQTQAAEMQLNLQYEETMPLTEATAEPLNAQTAPTQPEGSLDEVTLNQQAEETARHRIIIYLPLVRR